MSLKPFIFGQDPAQALLIKRLFSACVIYAFGFLLFALGIAHGLASPEGFVPLVLIVITSNLVIYAIVRSGLNRRAPEPDLTIPQMVIGTMVITYMLYHAPQIRGVYLLMHTLVMLFGLFRLRAIFILMVGAVAVLGYAGVIVLEAYNGIGQERRATDLLQLMMLAFIYPWFAQLGMHLTKTRHNLHQVNAKLKKTLADHRRLLEQIRIQATHDDLTGLHNRRYLISVMESESERMLRGGSAYSILVLDVDHFKSINDRYGHPVGDRVLVKFAEVLRAQLRTIDHFGRYGGEEFLVVLPQTRLDEARTAAERIRAAIETAQFGLEQKVTVSIGVACAGTGEAPDKVFSRADDALYRAKQNGRNRVECETGPSLSPSTSDS